jgi:hypothetical protein
MAAIIGAAMRCAMPLEAGLTPQQDGFWLLGNRRVDCRRF